MAELVKMAAYCFGAPLLLALAVSGRWRSPTAWLSSLAAVGVLVATLLAVAVAPPLLPTTPFIDALKWNWVGKVASIIVTLMAFLLLPAAAKEEAGLFRRPTPSNWGAVALVTIVLIAFFWTMAWLARDATATWPSRETILFQATMPGLDEEASFRGVILALLVGVFGKPVRFAGINFGWGALPIVTFFGLAHGFSAVSSGVAINWTTVAITGVTGVGLLWLKEKTHSIWVPVIVHNILNVGSVIIGG